MAKVTLYISDEMETGWKMLASDRRAKLGDNFRSAVRRAIREVPQQPREKAQRVRRGEVKE